MSLPCVVGRELEEARRLLAEAGVTQIEVTDTAPPAARRPTGPLRVVRQRVTEQGASLVVAACVPPRRKRRARTDVRAERSEAELLAALDLTRLPQHIAVIMDGNGRWAKERGLPRIEGHRASMQSIRDAVSACNDIGVKYLTLYAFSTENWSRPEDEVAALMMLIDHSVRAQVPELHEKRVRVRHLGRREGLPESLLRTLDESAATTAENPGLTLQLAINYGGRQEIADAARAAAQEVQAGTLKLEDVTEEALSRRMYQPETPDPDLLIRTGGDLRVSNYMLWEIAYTEIWVTATLWPDFRKRDVYLALAEFQRRQRRFGGVDDAA